MISGANNGDCAEVLTDQSTDMYDTIVRQFCPDSAFRMIEMDSQKEGIVFNMSKIILFSTGTNVFAHLADWICLEKGK